MSNLLEDPIFYGLLTNNSESNTTMTNSPSSLSAYSVVGGAVNLPVNHAKPPQQPFDLRTEPLDFSFLHKLSFPTASAPPAPSPAPVQAPVPGLTPLGLNSMPLNFDTHSVNSSYQASLFSEPLTAESVDDDSPHLETNAVKNQVNNTELLNSFKSIEELTGQSFLRDIPSTIQPVSEQSTAQASDKKFHKFYSDLSSTTSSRAPSPINKSLTYHKCPFCQRPFKNKSYLSRHLKKHDVVKEFKCPFFNENSSKCHHLNGEFSRKDTFKAHLKSIHFVYPIGVTKGDRSSSSGRCAGCFKEFENNSIWMTEHIDAELCSAAHKSDFNKDVKIKE